MSLSFFSVKKSNVKFTYEVTIHHLMKLPKNGMVLFISWNRGRKWSGETQKTFVKDKTAVWEQDFSLKASLFKNRQGKFKKKFMNFSFHEVIKDGNSKKGKIGEINLNLADFATQQQNEFIQTRTLPVKLWNSCDAQFKITIKCKFSPKVHGSLTDDLTTDTTDGSDDDEMSETRDGNENPSISVSAIKGASPLSPSSSSSSTTTPSSPLSMMSKTASAKNALKVSDFNEKRKSLVEETFKKLGHLDIDANSGDPKSNDMKKTSEMTIDERPKSKMTPKMKRLMNGHRRNTSISIDEDKDPFLSAINSQQLKKSPRGSNGTKANPEVLIETESKPLKSALSKLSKQEQELKLLYQKLAEQQRMEVERELVDTMINNVERLFSNGVPISAPIIFKALKHWNSFDPSQKDFLHKVSNTLEQIVKRYERSNEMLCYWLSNCFVFLTLMHKEFPGIQSTGKTPTITTTTISNSPISEPNKLIDNMGIPFLSINIPPPPSSLKDVLPLNLSLSIEELNKNGHSGGDDDFCFESPVSQFQSSINNVAFKIYSTLLKNIYEELAAIFIPTLFSPASDQVGIFHVTSILKKYLDWMKDNFVYSDVITKFFSQVFYFFNAQALKTLTTPQSNYCTMGYAIQLKMGITQLEIWCEENSETKEIKTLLNPVRQVSNILIMNKTSLVDEGTRKEVCPDLAISDIKQILLSYRPDEYDQEVVPSSVVKALPSLESKNTKETAKPNIIFKPQFKTESEIPGWQKIQPPSSLKSKKDFSFLYD